MCGFAGKGNNAKPRTLKQVAPWLVTPSAAILAKRRKESEGVQASAALAIMQGNDV